MQRLLGMQAAAADTHEHQVDGVAEQAMVRDTLRSPGEPLQAKTRAFFEPLLGCDLGQVRIHTGVSAAQSAAAVGALAYTAGSNVVFGQGQYAPHSVEGKRLLAHELTHVGQQRAWGPAGARTVVQRQPSSPAGGSSASTSSPGYEEEPLAPSFQVRIVAHASPRWRGAEHAADADRRNLELSRRRAETVRFAVEGLLAEYLGAGASTSIEVAVEEQDPGTVGVEAQARGSLETLPEAGGDRSDNALRRRRVDVIIESGQRVPGWAGASQQAPLIAVPTASRFWHVSILSTVGATGGVAGKLVALELTNDRSGQSLRGTVKASGGGIGLGLSASASIWGDPAGFYTEQPVVFRDFDDRWVRYVNAAVGLVFLGHERAEISFYGLGSGAKHIDVSGWTTGSVGMETAVVSGTLSLDKPYPPEERFIWGPDTTAVAYERTERGEDLHRVLFDTGSAALGAAEADILDSFVASVVASRRR